MNLYSAQALSNLACGGPGSGRMASGLQKHALTSPLHPERTNFNQHNSMMKQGFNYIGSKNLGDGYHQHYYQHPSGAEVGFQGYASEKRR